jgi:hypothetical protein
MPMPNGGLITETNRQYYEGAQSFIGDGSENSFRTTFNTNLIFGGPDAWDPNNEYYPLNNFKLYISPTGMPGTFVECDEEYTVVDNLITFTTYVPDPGEYVVVQLKVLTGGNYGNQEAYGTTVEENYGGYQYTKLVDVVNNFMVAYVGAGKIISDVKRTDVIFHAKRAMQEFSYDTLKSIKSQELTIPHSLSVVLPQDYVNYVGLYWVDRQGVKHPIYPANNLTSNPSEAPLQDDYGVEIQDSFNNNIDTEPIIEERWRRANTDMLNGTYLANAVDYNNGLDIYDYGWDNFGIVGRQYGLDPQYAQGNGWFTINDREGKISFSSNLHKMLITLDYISDGLAYDLDTRVPKMAEDAMYAYIIHAIVATRRDSPEYLVQRFNKEKFAKLRNAKLRLSNIKLHEIVQVMRGKSKWIKH